MKSRDLKHLKILSVLHYVLAGYFIFMGIWISFFILNIIIGSVKILCDSNGIPNPSESLDSWGAVFFVSALFILWWILATSLILTGNKLRKRKSRTFCLIIAGAECLSFPLGTFLGVFTLITLSRNSIKEIFEKRLKQIDCREKRSSV